MPEVPELPADDMNTPPMPEVPDMGSEMPNGGGEMPEVPEVETEEGDDSTMSIINQLSDEDRESVRAYAESMLNKQEEKGEEEVPEMPDEMQGNPQECKRFTKKQLKEEFGVKPNADEEMPAKNTLRTTLKNGNPFNPPKFN